MKQTNRLAAIDAALVAVSAALVVAMAFGVVGRRSANTCTMQLPQLLIDPGHGGEDGGAQAPDGTPEKQINLAIALPLGDLMQVMGYTVSYTRTDDTMVDAVGDTLRERKISDIHNRLALIEQADMTVSIHQNKFAQAKYYGTQVFYGTGNAESRVLGAQIRSSVLSLLQPDNTRELKPGESSVYLLAHATQPFVLVECGFLSNEVELQKLKTREYQRQMAFAIAGGILAATEGHP